MLGLRDLEGDTLRVGETEGVAVRVVDTVAEAVRVGLAPALGVRVAVLLREVVEEVVSVPDLEGVAESERDPEGE